MDTSKNSHIIYSSQTFIDDDSALEFDILQFTDEGGLIIQHHQKVVVNTLVVTDADEDVPRFTFTTTEPMYEKKDEKAELIIKDLQSSIKVICKGLDGGDGGKGGDGTAGYDVPFGSAKGMGGHGGIGGDGGKGGDGGNSPNLNIQYETSNKSEIIVETIAGKGGKGGKGGHGGKGGRNADGSYAPSGSDGEGGAPGKSGMLGTVVVNGIKMEE